MREIINLSPLAILQAENLKKDIEAGMINDQNILNVIDNLKEIVEAVVIPEVKNESYSLKQ